jgi:hypothetical protein
MYTALIYHHSAKSKDFARFVLFCVPSTACPLYMKYFLKSVLTSMSILKLVFPQNFVDTCIVSVPLCVFHIKM